MVTIYVLLVFNFGPLTHWGIAMYYNYMHDGKKFQIIHEILNCISSYVMGFINYCSTPSVT